jgi:hypothetical protein
LTPHAEPSQTASLPWGTKLSIRFIDDAIRKIKANERDKLMSAQDVALIRAEIEGARGYLDYLGWHARQVRTTTSEAL